MKKMMIILATLTVTACGGSSKTFYNPKYGRVSADNKYLQADFTRCTKQVGDRYRDGNDWADKAARCMVKRGWR